MHPGQLVDRSAAIDEIVASEETADRRARGPGTMIDHVLREGPVIAQS